MSDAYDMIDRFLRNNLGSDDDYAEYSKALDSLCGAQPAQAVPASCGECGKKTSDGWALYCVACMGEAGLPAQAVPLLSDDEIAAALPHEPGDLDFVCARAIEAAVRAKLGVTQWLPISTAPKDGTRVLLVIDHGEWGDAVWTGLWADGWMVSYGKAQATPTHWMPLPPPPIVGKEGA